MNRIPKIYAYQRQARRHQREVHAMNIAMKHLPEIEALLPDIEKAYAHADDIKTVVRDFANGWLTHWEPMSPASVRAAAAQQIADFIYS